MKRYEYWPVAYDTGTVYHVADTYTGDIECHGGDVVKEYSSIEDVLSAYPNATYCEQMGPQDFTTGE